MKFQISAERLKSGLLLIAFCLIFAGCATKEIEVVHTSLAPFEDSMKEYMRVGTNDEIPVTLGEKYLERDVGGHVLVHPRDFDIILKELSDDR